MDERIKYLFRKYINNTCTREEFEELFASLKQQKYDAAIEDAIDMADLELVRPKPVKRSYQPTLAIAAMILIIVVAGAVWYVRSGERRALIAKTVTKVQKQTLMKSTQRSEYKYLLLPDSTQVWLNAASTLEFPPSFDKKTRKVYLKGEAYFDVKHAEDVPFIIYTGEVTTEVLGTAFNIKAYPDLEKITVSVNRGKVKVNYANRQVALLTRGQQVSIGSRDRKVKEKEVKLPEALAWHEGNLVYDDYSIQDIISDLERIYDVKIRIGAPEISHLHVSTAFKRQYGVEPALQILCKLTETTLKSTNGIYYINQTKINPAK